MLVWPQSAHRAQNTTHYRNRLRQGSATSGLSDRIYTAA